MTFDDTGGVVLNKETKQVMPIALRDGSYEMEMWVPRDKGKQIHEVEEEEGMDFLRQGM